MLRQLQANMELLHHAIIKVAGEKVWNNLYEDRFFSASDIKEFNINYVELMQKLSSIVNEETFQKILKERGCLCSIKNRITIDPLKRVYSKLKDLEAFKKYLCSSIGVGYKYTLENGHLFLTYTPTNASCYCPALKSLPAEMTVPLNYCNCSKSFVETNFKHILNRPVTVEVLESCISGSKQCKFKITIIE